MAKQCLCLLAPCHFPQHVITAGKPQHFYYLKGTTSSFKYTEEHEWVQADGATATVGITHHAQDALGDVVFVELPKVGATFKQGDVAGVVESVKAAADVYMPLTGEVTEVNTALVDDPSLANTDPLGAGWFFKVKLSDVAQLDALMDETSYKQLIA